MKTNVEFIKTKQLIYLVASYIETKIYGKTDNINNVKLNR